MMINKWTLVLAGAGVVSLPGGSMAEEAMNAVSAAAAGTTISGFVSTSAHWDVGTGNANPPAYAFNPGKQDGFNLNVVNLTVQKALDDAAWSSGYRADLLFGPDANAYGTQSTGGGTGSDFGVRQAYVEVGAPVGNGLGFKMGVFDKIVGYESFDATVNSHYTRSYGYTLQPTTHTGVLASYEVLEGFTLLAGVANTFGPAINGRAGTAANPRAESYKTYMAGFSVLLPESCGALAGSTFYGGIVNGFSGSTTLGGGEVSANQTSLSVGGRLKTGIEGLTLGAAYDYVGVHDGDGSVFLTKLGSSAYGWAAAIYGSFQASEKLSLHWRGEYYARSPHRDVLPAQPGGQAGSSFSPGFLPSKALGVTGTVQYDLWANVLTRLEVRWDHAADGDRHFDGMSGFVGGPGPTDKNAVLVAANLVYQF